jgi:hypothetical protein
LNQDQPLGEAAVVVIQERWSRFAPVSRERATTRRKFLVVIACGLTGVCALPHPLEARRFRVNLGRGIAAGGRKTYSASTLTQSQLEECLEVEAKLEHLDQLLDKSETSVEAEQAKLTLQKSALESRQRAVNRHSQSEVDAFNRYVDQYEQARVQFNGRVNAHNSLVESGRGLVESYNGRCANKSYYEDDMQAARSAVQARRSSNTPRQPGQQDAKAIDRVPNYTDHHRQMLNYSPLKF